MGAFTVLELRQTTRIFAVETVIWRTEVSIASLIRARIDSTSGSDDVGSITSICAQRSDVREPVLPVEQQQRGFTGTFEIVAAEQPGVVG
jgi:hypothetical protein